jgi:hypothetical protein
LLSPLRGTNIDAEYLEERSLHGKQYRKEANEEKRFRLTAFAIAKLE